MIFQPPAIKFMKIKKNSKKKEISETIEKEENEGHTNNEKMKKIVFAECMVVVVLVIALIVHSSGILEKKEKVEKEELQNTETIQEIQAQTDQNLKEADESLFNMYTMFIAGNFTTATGETFSFSPQEDNNAAGSFSGYINAAEPTGAGTYEVQVEDGSYYVTITSGTSGTAVRYLFSLNGEGQIVLQEQTAGTQYVLIEG